MPFERVETLSEEQIEQLARATYLRDSSDIEYKRLMVKLHDEGHSFAELGRVSGQSRQSIYRLIQRETRWRRKRKPKPKT